MSGPSIELLKELGHFLATNLDLEEQRTLVRYLPPPPLYTQLDQQPSLEKQARAVVELLRQEQRLDSAFFLALSEHLPAKYEEICCLAGLAEVPAPPRPSPCAIRGAPGIPQPVLAITAPIGEHDAPITDAQIAEAIAPHPILGGVKRIDLHGPDGAPASMDEAQRRLKREIPGFLQYGLGADFRGIAPIFAFGPIPVLAAVGAVLGNKAPTRVMQRYNWLQPAWGWYREAPAGGGWLPARLRRPGTAAAGHVGLLLSVSADVDIQAATRHLPDGAPIWELRIEKPFRDQIRTEAQLQEFRQIYARLMAKLEAVHGREVTILLFPAVPVAIAVAIGDSLIPKAMPAVHLYDYRSGVDDAGRTTRSFYHALTLAGPQSTSLG